MVVREARTSAAAPDGEAVRRLLVPHLCRVEVLLEVGDHAVAGVAIRSEERVVVPDTVQRLTHALPWEPRLSAVLGGERLDRAFFRFDVALDLAPASFIGDDLLCGGSDERVSE